MNARPYLLAAALAVAASSQAFAQELVPATIFEGTTAQNAQPGQTAQPVQKSRAQVRAETAAADRLGLVHFGEAGPREATPQDLRVIADAGRAAVLAEQQRNGNTQVSQMR